MLCRPTPSLSLVACAATVASSRATPIQKLLAVATAVGMGCGWAVAGDLALAAWAAHELALAVAIRYYVGRGTPLGAAVGTAVPISASWLWRGATPREAICAALLLFHSLL